MTTFLDRTAGLRLPNGRHPEDIRLGALYVELRRLGVPGISSSMGKHDLVQAFYRFVASTPEGEQTLKSNAVMVTLRGTYHRESAAACIARSESAFDPPPDRQYCFPIATTSTRFR